MPEHCHMAKKEARHLPYGSGEFFAHWQNRCMSTGIPNERLKAARKEAKLTLEKAAEAVKISVSQLSRFESGTREPRQTEMQALAELYEKRVADLFEDGQITSVPVMGYIGAGGEILPEFEQVPKDGLDQVDLPFSVPPEIIAFRVKGISMIPAYKDGDAVLVWKDQRLSTDNYIGEEVALKTTDGRRFLKELQRGHRRGLFNLHSYNDNLIENVGVDWIGEIYVTVRAQTIRRAQRSQVATETRRRNAREVATDGMDELPLDKGA